MLPILGVSFVDGAIGQLAAALLQRMLLFRALATVDLISSIIGVFVGCTTAWFGSGVWALIAAQLSVRDRQGDPALGADTSMVSRRA